MRFKLIFKMFGNLLNFISVGMLLSMIVSLLYKESPFPFIYSIGITLIVGIFLRYVFFRKEDEKEIGHLEGFAIASLTWLVLCFFASLPFHFSGTFNSYIDGYFETVSGFTTTGSTVITNIEIQPRGILFWRSIIQWIGGMGIIVLALAIFPNISIGGMKLYQAEVPGPTKDKVVPRVKDTAKILWSVYFGLTLAETLLLLFGGMHIFEAVCHSLTTLPTGGFSPNNDSVASYNPFIQWVIAIFMLLGGANFTLHYLVFVKGKVLYYLKDAEFKFYLFMVFISTILISSVLYIKNYYGNDLGEIIRHSFFSVSTMISTGGFMSTDFNTWPDFCKFLLVCIPLIGGCVGSTGGGIKNMRIFLLLKYSYNRIINGIYPDAVKVMKINGEAVPKEVLTEINSTFFLFISTFLGGSLLISLFGYDIITSFTSVVATMTNTGPGLNLVGPTQNFAFFHPACKIIFCFLMVLGRLEFYSVLIFIFSLFRLNKS